MRSIRRVLLFWLLGIVLFGVVLAGVLIYRQAQAEANALFDYQLQQTAAALPSEPFSSVLSSHANNGEGVVIQIWSRDGAQLYYSHPRAPLAPRAELGFSTERTPVGDWRVYSAIVGDNVVQLAQPMAIRNVLAAETAWRTIWPLLILLPVLGVGVWVIVGRGLTPLSRLARALEARTPEAVAPLPDRKLPPEIRPVVRALNGLLQRLTLAMDTQRAFVADAAHELRTPLAALRIQAQLLERAHDDAQRQEALTDLQAGVQRATRLVEQLLSLARADAPPFDSSLLSAPHGVPTLAPDTEMHKLTDSVANKLGAAPQRHALLTLVQACVAAHSPLAMDKGVDLGIEAAVDVEIAGDAEALRIMIGNLLDNAVKYTPPGGRVDVSLGPLPRANPAGAGKGRESMPTGAAVAEPVAISAPGVAFLEIADTGPGIAPEERTRVFDRFYRAPDRLDPQGSGLGLAIVKGIAERHHATIALAEASDDGSGLRVTVTFTL